ncbi:decapping mRNA 1B [Pitangus sulphuratus]|nr:decapping mRNA 1B [Pitangus sulphuratus]
MDGGLRGSRVLVTTFPRDRQRQQDKRMESGHGMHVAFYDEAQESYEDIKPQEDLVCSQFYGFLEQAGRTQGCKHLLFRLSTRSLGEAFNLVFTEKEEELGNVKVEGSLGCSKHNILQFNILEEPINCAKNETDGSKHFLSVYQDSKKEKTDVEGTLFVYTRSASPRHGFTIMNRLSMENRTEPITKDLDFQLQDPFLLYRNARFGYGWMCSSSGSRQVVKTQCKEKKSSNPEVNPKIHSCVTLESSLKVSITICQHMPELKTRTVTLTNVDRLFGDSVVDLFPGYFTRALSHGLSIYGIWFYDKEECQRIAELMKNLTQQEQFKAQQGTGTGVSPMLVNSASNKEVDILRMLTKAKDEYTKCKTCSEPKQITSSSAIYNNPNLIKPIPVKPSENQQQRLSQQSKNADPEPQHLSLTALFGKQDVSEPLNKQHPENLPVRQGVVRSLSYEEPSRQSPSAEKQLCPAIQKLMVRGTDLHPLAEFPENRLCENGNIHPVGETFTGLFQPVTSHGIATSHMVQDAAGTQSLLQKLQSQSGSVTKMDPSATGPVNSTASVFSRTPAAVGAPAAAAVNNMSQPPLVYFNGSLPGQTLEAQTLGKEQSKLPRQPLSLSGNQAANSGVISPQELLKKLQIVQQEQQLHVSSRPTLAAKFPVVTQSTNTLKPLDSWIEKAPGTEKQSALFQVISPQRIPATVTPTLLMSPMVFTQATPAPPKASDSGRLAAASQDPAAGSANLLLPLQTPEPAVANSTSMTKMQLQETLLHLIQNDDNFLNIIYEAYLFSVRKAAMKKSM